MTSESRITPAWTLAILAGGRSSRMGVDKAGLTAGGVSWVEHLARRLAGPGIPVVVSTREQDGPGSQSGHPIILDRVPGAGPLSAMESVLAKITTPYALFVPCDMLALPKSLGDRLLRHAPGVDGVAMKFKDRVEPFPALLSAELAPSLKEWVSAGERRADLWLHRSPARVVPYGFLFPEDPEGHGLANVNDPETLSSFDWGSLT